MYDLSPENMSLLNAVFVYIVAIGKIQSAGFFPWKQRPFSLNKVN
ncbi:hypothetical protein BSG1_01265 [Bacillus sp. SG-1]|nr:hypothetical protein BSG1_01265 [Bacillus sp. SG-1]